MTFRNRPNENKVAKMKVTLSLKNNLYYILLNIKGFIRFIDMRYKPNIIKFISIMYVYIFCIEIGMKLIYII